MQLIRRRLAKETINEKSVSPEERLAVCLYCLERGTYYHTISQMSGLGIATVCNIVTEVSQTVMEYLLTKYVTEHFPKSEKMFIDKMIDTRLAVAFRGTPMIPSYCSQTDLWKQITEGELIPNIGKTIGKRTIVPVVLGDCLSIANMAHEAIHKCKLNRRAAVL